MLDYERLKMVNLFFFPVSPIHSKELNIYKLFNKFELNVN